MFGTLASRPSAVDACTSALRAAILGGEAPIGSRLPPERDLADKFGVNRVTVRSALGRLAGAGLVAVRQGSGYVVRDYRRSGGPDLVLALFDLAKTSADLKRIARDLLLVRESLAQATLARLAEAPPNRRSILVIEKAVDALEALALRGAPATEIAEADVEVLGTVLDATRSSVLQLFLNPVTSLLRGFPELSEALYAAPTENVAAFRLLLRWLEHPDPGGIPIILGAMRTRDDDTLGRLTKAAPGERRRASKRPESTGSRRHP